MDSLQVEISRGQWKWQLKKTKHNNTGFKRQVVYLGSKNCNSEYTDLSRNPNSVLIRERDLGNFIEKKLERRKIR